FLDYPLRTAAMMGIFAFACGLLIEPISSDGRRVKHKNNETHSNMSRVPQQSADIASTEPAVAAAPRQPAARWGQNIDWPEAWRKPKLEDGTPVRTREPVAPEKPEGPKNGN